MTTLYCEWFCWKYGICVVITSCFYLKVFESFDFLILGEHFWTTEEDGPWSGTPTEDEERIRAYVDAVIEAMKACTKKSRDM